VVCTLGTESFRPSAAAQCVQLIAMVELPRGLWPGLIQTLVHNVTNPASTEIVKESTLQAVGYICQVTMLIVMPNMLPISRPVFLIFGSENREAVMDPDFNLCARNLRKNKNGELSFFLNFKIFHL
jgi:hypothetical protein